MADAGSWFRDNIGTLFGAESTDEQNAEQQLEQAQQVWGGLGSSAPSQADLMGLTPSMGGGMSDDWYNQWLQSSGYGGAGSTGGTSGGQASMYSPTSYRTGDPRNGGTTLRTASGATSVSPYGTAQNKGGDMYMGGGAYSGAPTADGAESPWTVSTSHYGMDAQGNYIPGSAGGSDPSMSGRRMPEGDLRQMAQQAYMAEQMRNDPYFGLSQLGTPEMAGAQADPQAIEAQRRALQQMQGIADAGGWTQEERSQNRMAQQDASRYEQSQRAAAQQQAAMRGMNQSGAAMMGALSAQQGGANRAADSGDRFAIEGQRRALQAMQQAGNWGTQMRGQSFGEESPRGGGVDEWNRANVGAQNAWTANRGAMAQQQFQNQATVAAGQTGQYETGAKYYQGQDAQGSALANTAADIYRLGQQGQQGPSGTSGGIR
jgi:hypothetical protein